MAVKLLARPANADRADLLVVGPRSTLERAQRIAGTRIDPRVQHSERPEPAGGEPALGAFSEAAGAIALDALRHATELARRGEVEGVVYAPLNKHALRLAGMREEDELRFMQDLFGIEAFTCEFNITGKLWTARVTSHVPLREVADLITQQSVRDAVHLIARTLRTAGIARPRIAVSGLNPHAGDGGSIGREEIEVIAPAVESLRAEGVEASGPWSPDIVFLAARRGDFDAVVSMYHDQGQIAMKLLGFESGVTVAGGLPVPVMTSASGSAFDIAGKGIARVDGLQSAFDLCARMAAQKLREPAAVAA
nr:4-hydroxythreonine-4-phosphate dehydrogenase PdxA [Ramlibacter paludis]